MPVSPCSAGGRDQQLQNWLVKWACGRIAERSMAVALKTRHVTTITRLHTAALTVEIQIGGSEL
jgi:hypothetical protein